MSMLSKLLGRDEELRKALTAMANRWEGIALDLEREVERGDCIRQSPESKLSRAQVLRSNAEQVREALKGGR